MNKHLKRLYKQIPAIQCKQKCQESCGPILMSDAEKAVIMQHMNYDPFLGPLLNLMSGNNSCLTCPLLKDEKCSIYDIRPLICRLYGVVKEMRCEYGCVPEKWLSDEKARELLSKAEEI